MGGGRGREAAGGRAGLGASAEGAVPSPEMAARRPRRGEHVMAERREERRGEGRDGTGREGRAAVPAQGRSGPGAKARDGV